MAESNLFRELVDCVERRLGTLDDFDRRIIDYWYVCGRQSTRRAEDVNRWLTAGDWSGHVLVLWRAYRSCYEELGTAYQLGTLEQGEIDVYVEVARILREVAKLVNAKRWDAVSDDELAVAGISDLLEIFYAWDNPRRIQAYLFTNSGRIPPEELEEKSAEVYDAIQKCLEQLLE